MGSVFSFVKEKRSIRSLKRLDETQLGFFTFSGQKFPSRCIDVYDGDTVTLIIPIKDSYYKMKCRLYGIDTPEKRTKDDFEKKCAIIARDRMIELIHEKVVWIECIDWDKYGRLLANIYLKKSDMKNGKDSVNNLMISENMAYGYEGGKKIEFSDWKNRFGKK